MELFSLFLAQWIICVQQLWFLCIGFVFCCFAEFASSKNLLIEFSHLFWRTACHLQIGMIIWCLSFLLYRFYFFLSLSWLLSLKFQVLYGTGMVRVDSIVLFLILEGMFSIFPHFIWCSLQVCHVWLSSLSGRVFIHLCSSSFSVQSWRDVWLCQKLFLHFLWWWCYFIPDSILCGVLHLLTYVEPFLNPKDEADLVMIYNFF